MADNGVLHYFVASIMHIICAIKNTYLAKLNSAFKKILDLVG